MCVVYFELCMCMRMRACVRLSRAAPPRPRTPLDDTPCTPPHPGARAHHVWRLGGAQVELQALGGRHLARGRPLRAAAGQHYCVELVLGMRHLRVCVHAVGRAR
jgi:hypothetical protein